MIINEIKENKEFFASFPYYTIDILTNKEKEIKLSELILLFPFEDWKNESISVSNNKNIIIDFLKFYMKKIYIPLNEKKYYNIVWFRLSFAISFEIPIFITITFPSKILWYLNSIKIEKLIEEMFDLTLGEIEEKYKLELEINYNRKIKDVYEGLYNKNIYSSNEIQKIFEIYNKSHLKNIISKNKIFMFYISPTGNFKNYNYKTKENLNSNIKQLANKTEELISFVDKNKEVFNKLIYVKELEQTIEKINTYLDKLDTKNNRTLNNLINLKEEIKDIKNKKERLDKLIKTLETIINN